MKPLKLFLLIIIGVTLLACSKADDEKNQEHFLSGQQRALERAQDVNAVIQQAEEKKRQQLENIER
ncbi:MAG TPA: hypothetical protein VIM41_02235 [Gammaproteobacteria bacterium]